MDRQQKYQMPSQQKSRQKANEQRKTMNANLSELEALNRATAVVIPKGHPLSPQIADKTVKPFKKPLYAKTYNI